MKKIFFIFTMMLSVVTVCSQQIYKLNIDKLADGPYEKMSGNIKITGEVLDGKKTGTWTEYHPNVELPHYIIQYKEDKIDGLYIEVDRQAYIMKKQEYKNDTLEGVSYEWFKGGRLSKRQEYKKGKLDGKTVIYYDKGFLQEESEYKDGKKNGVTVWYAYGDKEQGPKVAMYTYQNGLFEGPQDTYYEDGKVFTHKMFSNNVLNGLTIEYYEDGSVKSEANYKDGKLKGKVKEYKQGKKFVENNK